ARLEPRRDLAVQHLDVVAHDDHRLGLVAEGDDVALAHEVARDGDAAPVHEHVAVAHELAGLAAARAPAGAERDVVEALLEHAQQVLAGDALLAVRLLVEVAELLLEDAVDATSLLLLTQLDEVLAVLAAHLRAAVVPGGVRTLLDRALHRVALAALEEQLHLLAPAELADRTGVARHDSDPPSLGRATTVVRGRG